MPIVELSDIWALKKNKTILIYADPEHTGTALKIEIDFSQC